MQMTLAEWLKSKGMTDDSFAEGVGVSRSMVTKLRNRTAKPSADTAMAVMTLTDGMVSLPEMMPLIAEDSVP